MKISIILCLVVLLLALPVVVGAQEPSPTSTPILTSGGTPVVVSEPSVPFTATTPLDDVIAWVIMAGGFVLVWREAVYASVQQAKERIVAYLPFLNDPSIKPVRSLVIVLTVFVASYVTVKSGGYSIFIGAPDKFVPSQTVQDVLTALVLPAAAFLRHDELQFKRVTDSMKSALEELQALALSIKANIE